MAEVIEIPIYIRSDDRSKILFAPFEVVKVPLGTVVRWKIEYDRAFRNFLKRPGFFSFQIYFPNKSPFSWQRQQSRTIGNLSKITQDLILAEGIPNSSGEFKYGIKAIDTIYDETIDDEDPQLFVY